MAQSSALKRIGDYFGFGLARSERGARHKPIVNQRKRAGFTFLNGGSFLENMLAFRLVWIRGRLGSGKTLLAVALSRWLYDNNYIDGMLTNINVNPAYVPVIRHVRRSAVVLDEAGAFADSRNSMNKSEGYGAFARKFDSYWLSPSKIKPDGRMGDLIVRRNLELIGLDWLIYSWLDNEGEQKGWFALVGYRELFGQYQHTAIPASDGGIKRLLREAIEEQAVEVDKRVWTPQQWEQYKRLGYIKQL